MNNNYSDRDYFDEKFQSIEDRFDTLEKKMDKISTTIYGNGKIGLVEEVRNNAKKITMVLALLAALTPVYIKESRDALIKALTGLIGGI